MKKSKFNEVSEIIQMFFSRSKFLVFFMTFLLLTGLYTGFSEVLTNPEPLRLMVLITGENGEWTPRLQSSIYRGDVSTVLSGKDSGVNIQVVSPLCSFDETVISRLNPEQILELLRYPSIFNRSSLTDKLFTIDYLVEINVIKIGGILWSKCGIISLKSGSSVLLGLVPSGSSNKAVETFLGEIPKKLSYLYKIDNSPVTGETSSKNFHLQNPRHKLKDGEKVEYPTTHDAIKAGFSRCRHCFPDFTENRMEVSLDKLVTGIIESNNRLYPEPSSNNRLNRIGKKIVESNQLDGEKYVFRVIDTSNINSFSSPGGKIYISRGMINFLGNDDELATFVAREIGIVERGDFTHYLLRSVITCYEETKNDTGYFSNPSNIGRVAQELVEYRQDRKHYSEADRLGLVLVKNAGYNPKAYREGLERLLNLEKSGVTGRTILRDFPINPERMETITGYVEIINKSPIVPGELGKIDPGTAEYLKKFGVFNLKEADYIGRLADIMDKLILEQETAGQVSETPGNTNTVSGDYELIPIDQAGDILKNLSERIRPPEKIPLR
jgi:beta-barrel assembly-enhancing protease